MSRKAPTLENKGSLITYRDCDSDRCLGYLFHSPEHGTYDPTFGRVEVTREEAETHNRLLSQAEIEGLDKNCAIGMCGNFYYRSMLPRKVVTWHGDLVSDHVDVRGGVIQFYRNGMTFRGRLRKDSDFFTFERIA